MHLKVPTRPAVVVLYVSFSYPVASVCCSIGFKLNQMSPVVVFVHGDRLSILLCDRIVLALPLVAAMKPRMCQHTICRELALSLQEVRYRSRKITRTERAKQEEAN
jgi:hypothetical protein